MRSPLHGRTLALLILGALGSAWGSEGKEPLENLAFVDGGGRVMVRVSGQTKQVAAGPASLVAWSPSGDRVAYVEIAAPYSPDPVVLHVVSEDGRSLETLAIQQGSLVDEIPLEWRGLDQLVWLDGDRLALGGSYDPSNGILAVVDLAAGKVARAYVGREFSWSPSRDRLANVGWIPQDAPPEIRAHDRIEIDGRTVYPAQGRAQSSGRIRGPLLWAPDGRTLAFLEERDKQFQLVFLTTDGSERSFLLAGVSKPVTLAWTREGDALLLKDDQRYLAVESPTGKQVELPEEAALDRLPALAERKRREGIERSAGAVVADWWP